MVKRTFEKQPGKNNKFWLLASASKLVQMLPSEKSPQEVRINWKKSEAERQKRQKRKVEGSGKIWGKVKGS